MRILIRTEGNHQKGMGDVWSSIALADECVRYFDDISFMVSDEAETVYIIKARGYEFFTVNSLLREQEVITFFQPDLVLVTMLNNPPSYIKFLKEFPCFVVTVDDAGEGAKSADLNINVLYPIPGAVTGLKFLALRNEFQKAHKKVNTIREDIQELLVTQGGSDTYGFTPQIIRALEGVGWRPHCTVVVGPAFQHEVDLDKAVQSSTLDLTIRRNPPHMHQLMEKADLAITAGGLTMFELACVGTPSLVICGEPFEVETAQRLENAGVVVNLGFGGNLDFARVPIALYVLAGNSDKRRHMSLRGKQLIDGRGSERVVGMIRERVEALGAWVS